MKYAALLGPIFLLDIVGLASAGPAAQAPSAATAASVPATAADIKAGAQVRDSKSVEVAKVVEMQNGDVVLDTGQTKIAVPMNLFAKDGQGLMLTITADQFNGAIAKAHARSQAAKAAQQHGTEQQQLMPPKH